MDVSAHTSAEQADDARPASIHDVATAAGVSYQTVSRVINGHPSVKSSTRAARTGHHQPTWLPAQPRGPRAGRRRGPGGDRADLEHHPVRPAAAIQGIEEAARAADFAMGVRVIESEEPAAVADAVERAIEPGGALIVVAFDRAGTLALAAVPPGVPMVGIVETPVGGEGDGKPWVWIDDRQAAAKATAYLTRPRPPDRSLHLHPVLHRHQPAPRGLAVHARGGRGAGAGADPGRLAPALGLRGRPDTRPRPRGHRGALRKRRSRARRHQGAAGGRTGGPRRRQRGRLRRHPAGGVRHARPDHGPPGLHRPRAGVIRRRSRSRSAPPRRKRTARSPS